MRYRSLLPAAALAVALVACSARAADVNDIKEKLFQAKKQYDEETRKFRTAVSDALDKREAAARKSGDKKALDAVKGDRDRYDKTGELPPDAPKAALAQVTAARGKLDKVYADAVRDLVKLKEDDAATAVEKEGQKFAIDAALMFGKRTPLTNYKALDVQVANNFFEKDTGKFKMDGEAVPHSVLMHPRTNSDASAGYALGGRMTVFRSHVGVPKHEGIAGDPATPLIFEVLGDGKSLWKSEPVAKLDTFQACEVRIDKVKTLTLRVSCPGDQGRAHAVWFGPVVIE